MLGPKIQAKFYSFLYKNKVFLEIESQKYQTVWRHLLFNNNIVGL